MEIFDQLKFNTDGLIPAITQDERTGDVLMIGWMNRESLQKTIETRRATYWSRSRKELWIKGTVSGNVQEVKSVHVDCDGDAILLKVHQIGGAACHTGHRTCFYREVVENGNQLRESGELVFDPKTVYRK